MHTPARAAAAPDGKSPTELKEILRSMTVRNGAEREQKETQNKQSLKDTLAGVMQKSVQREPVIVPQSPPAQQAGAVPSIEEKKPFEVPEDTLQKVLKGET